MDDLAALALALDVSPATLMMPVTQSREDSVPMTGGGTITAERMWSWLGGAAPPPGSEQTAFQFGGRAWPKWEHTRARLNHLLRELGHDEMRTATIDPMASRQLTRGQDGDDQ